MSRPRWEYMENGQFYAFDDHTSNHIEEQYIRQPYSVIKVPIFGAIFEISFAKMTRTDVRRSVADEIRRVVPDRNLPSILNANDAKKPIHVWHYNDNGYRKLDPQTNGKFERTFAKNPNSKFVITILQQRFIVDFSAMQLTHTETSSTHQLLRLDITQNAGFVIPKAVENAKRNIVAGKVKSGKRIALPSELKLFEALSGIPTAKDFASWTLETPNIELLKPSNNLPLLPPTEYEHRSTCAICYDELLHRKTAENAADFEEVEDYDESFHSRVTCFPCGHVYHHRCAQASLKSQARCPSCRAPVSASFGGQPEGTMSVRYTNDSVSGFRKFGTITIDFNMRGGVQEDRHQHPGVSYSGDSRTHYMPASAQGFRALRWIAKAWMQFSMFTVGYSGTRMCDNVVIYAIHLKTSTSGGESGHGWPDATYFKRLHSEITDAGIMIEDYSKEYDEMKPEDAPPVDDNIGEFASMGLESL